MSLNSYFESVFCIHLKDSDRRPHIDQEFKKHQLDVMIVDAIDGRKLTDYTEKKSSDDIIMKRGDIACTLSHLKVVNMAKAANLKNYFVFEDDVVLCDDFNKRFNQEILEMPTDWDMIYFGGNHEEPFTPITDHIAKISKTFTTHAIGIKETVYDALINIWGQYEKVDISISSLHKQFNCYLFRPHLAWQKAGYSYLQGKYDNYEHLKK